MALAEITVIPIGTESTSLSSYVADMQRSLEQVDGIVYELTAMGTIIEGRWIDYSRRYAHCMRAHSRAGLPGCRPS